MTRRIAPGFELRLLDGRTVTHRRYRYRSNLVLIFADGGEGALDRTALRDLQSLASAADLFGAENGKMLAVIGRPSDAVPNIGGTPDLDVATDPGSKLRQAYASRLRVADRGQASLYILDRYGAPFAVLTEAELAAESTRAEVLSWLKFVELQCPE